MLQLALVTFCEREPRRSASLLLPSRSLPLLLACVAFAIWSCPTAITLRTTERWSGESSGRPTPEAIYPALKRPRYHLRLLLCASNRAAPIARRRPASSPANDVGCSSFRDSFLGGARFGRRILASVRTKRSRLCRPKEADLFGRTLAVLARMCWWSNAQTRS